MEGIVMPQMKLRLPKRLPSTFAQLVRLYPPQAIHGEAAYAKTQRMIDWLTDEPRLSAGQSEYLDTLTVLLEAYEQQHETIDELPLNPIDALRVLLDERGMSASDLGR